MCNVVWYVRKDSGERGLQLEACSVVWGDAWGCKEVHNQSWNGWCGFFCQSGALQDSTAVVFPSNGRTCTRNCMVRKKVMKIWGRGRFCWVWRTFKSLLCETQKHWRTAMRISLILNCTWSFWFVAHQRPTLYESGCGFEVDKGSQQ